MTLPDLVSRLRAMRLVKLGPPDDDLLRRVLTKLFADRQIDVDPGVVGYHRRRAWSAPSPRPTGSSTPSTMPRSPGGRGVTRRLAAEMLGEIGDDAQGDLLGDPTD